MATVDVAASTAEGTTLDGTASQMLLVLKMLQNMEQRLNAMEVQINQGGSETLSVMQILQKIHADLVNINQRLNTLEFRSRWLKDQLDILDP
jgi:hypothetical protein